MLIVSKFCHLDFSQIWLSILIELVSNLLLGVASYLREPAYTEESYFKPLRHMVYFCCFWNRHTSVCTKPFVRKISINHLLTHVHWIMSDVEYLAPLKMKYYVHIRFTSFVYSHHLYQLFNVILIIIINVIFTLLKWRQPSSCNIA